jgi:hypothetical protein
MLFEAAEKNIKQMGIDPSSVTYDMVMNRISELEAEKAWLDKEYSAKYKELREMKKQMDVMKQYMEKQGLRTKEAARSGKKNKDDRAI